MKALWMSLLLGWVVGIANAAPASTPSASASGAQGAKYASFREAYDAGNLFLKGRKFAPAVAAYLQAGDLTTSASAKAQALNAAGWTYIKARKWLQAQEVLLRATQSDPKNKIALGNLGYADLKIYQYGLGDASNLQEAIKNLEACAAIDASYKADLLETAKTIRDRREAEGTVTPIPAPKPGVSYNDAKILGDKAQAQGQYDLALQYFRKAEAASKTPKAKGTAANRQGLVLLEARRPKEAVAHFERAIKADPTEKIFLNNLGLAYWTLYDAGLADVSALRQSVSAFYRANDMDASYHGDNLRMALSELKEVDPDGAKPYDSKRDPTTGEAAPMGSPTTR